MGLQPVWTSSHNTYMDSTVQPQRRLWACARKWERKGGVHVRTDRRVECVKTSRPTAAPALLCSAGVQSSRQLNSGVVLREYHGPWRVCDAIARPALRLVERVDEVR